MKEQNLRFAKWLVLVNAAVPATLLGWDAWQHKLGASPVNFAILTTGLMALIFLLLTLLVTPLRKISGWNWIISFRRTLGLYAFFYACLHFLIFFQPGPRVQRLRHAAGNGQAQIPDRGRHGPAAHGAAGRHVHQRHDQTARRQTLAGVAPAGVCGRHRGRDPLQDAGESRRAPAAGVYGSPGRSAGIPAGDLLAPARCRHTCSARLNANRNQSLNGHIPLRISTPQPYAQETTAL